MFTMAFLDSPENFIIWIVVLAVLGFLGTLAFWGLVIYFAMKSFQGAIQNYDSFASLNVDKQFKVIDTLYRQGNFHQINTYMDNSPGPVTSDLMGMCASNGLDMSFLQ